MSDVAKLSARGRTELARIRIGRERNYSDGEGTQVVVSERALMSDRNILVKHTWPKTATSPGHSTGWKVAGKLKKNVGTDEWVERWVAQGWERVK